MHTKLVLLRAAVTQASLISWAIILGVCALLVIARAYHRKLDSDSQSSEFRIKMKKSPTQSSHGSTQHLKKGRQSLVLSLADQKLTLEDNDSLDQFDDGKSNTRSSQSNND